MIACIAGTRPEVIKIAPIIQEFRKLGIPVDLILTGQHRELASDLLPWFDLRNVVRLSVNYGANIDSNLANTILELTKSLDITQYVGVLGQGDTTSALAAAIWGFFNKKPFYHVEAGLRCETTYLPFPEEINRRLITQLATFNFSPTRRGEINLLKEGISKSAIAVVGNTVIDAFKFTNNKISINAITFAEIENLKLENHKTMLVTAHRRESFGQPMLNICAAIKRIALDNDLNIVWPLHPNPNVKPIVERELAALSNVHLLPPLSYPAMVNLMNRVDVIMTDSGGLQEEAAAAHKPVLILRNETEREEIIECGLGKLVGTDVDVILQEFEALSLKKFQIDGNVSRPFGDGNSSKLIVQKIESDLFGTNK